MSKLASMKRDYITSPLECKNYFLLNCDALTYRSTSCAAVFQFYSGAPAPTAESFVCARFFCLRNNEHFQVIAGSTIQNCDRNMGHALRVR
jgi:hypothetical protein